MEMLLIVLNSACSGIWYFYRSSTKGGEQTLPTHIDIYKAIINSPQAPHAGAQVSGERSVNAVDVLAYVAPMLQVARARN